MDVVIVSARTQQSAYTGISAMKKILLGTTVLFGLAGPAFADPTPVNTIAIDQDLGASGSLAISQTGLGNTVSADGTTGAGATQISLGGPWHSIAITQSGAGGNTFQGSPIAHSGSTTASLNATYAATSTGTNAHTLNIGGGAAPSNPTVVVNVTNATSSNNLIVDSIDAGTLAYNLGLSGGGATIANAVSSTTGSVTLTEGNGGFAGVHNYYGISGDGNNVSNDLVGGSGAVLVEVLVNGGGNILENNVSTNGGAITLTQGGTSSTGIVGTGNSVTNNVGQGTPVGSFVQTLYVNGNYNTVLTTVDGGGGATASVSITGSNVDYELLSEGGGSYSNVALTGVGGTGLSAGSTDIVRVQQTGSATTATAILTVNGGGNTMGNLSTAGAGSTSLIPGYYGSSGAGVAVYQNTSGAYLNAQVTASGSGYTALFKQ